MAEKKVESVDLQHVNEESLCPCGSARRFKHCCGYGKNSPHMVLRISKTKQPRTHFFITNFMTREVYVDARGLAPVFSSETQVVQLVMSLGPAFQMNGMTAETFKRFEVEQAGKYFLVPSSIAAA